MRNILLISIFILAGCQQSTKVKTSKQLFFADTCKLSNDCPYTVSKKSSMVVYESVYRAWFGPGSVLYSCNTPQAGYEITVKDCEDKVISTQFCSKSGLNETVKSIVNGLTEKDSVVAIIKHP